MSRKIALVEQGELEIYDPERGLRTIAVAEAGEKHWARAKDAKQLCKAIETKIKAQAEYVVWRDKVVVPSQTTGKKKKTDGIAAPKSQKLPAADPGHNTAHRWRAKLCHKGETGTCEEHRLGRFYADARRDRVFRSGAA
jgi:hypothetical protein